jgi:hypothetical protein
VLPQTTRRFATRDSQRRRSPEVRLASNSELHSTPMISTRAATMEIAVHIVAGHTYPVSIYRLVQVKQVPQEPPNGVGPKQLDGSKQLVKHVVIGTTDESNSPGKTL